MEEAEARQNQQRARKGADDRERRLISCSKDPAVSAISSLFLIDANDLPVHIKPKTEFDYSG